MTWWINGTNMSAYKLKQFIVTRRRRATHVIDKRDTREQCAARRATCINGTHHANDVWQHVRTARMTRVNDARQHANNARTRRTNNTTTTSATYANSTRGECEKHEQHMRQLASNARLHRKLWTRKRYSEATTCVNSATSGEPLTDVVFTMNKC